MLVLIVRSGGSGGRGASGGIIIVLDEYESCNWCRIVVFFASMFPFIPLISIRRASTCSFEGKIRITPLNDLFISIINCFCVSTMNLGPKKSTTLIPMKPEI